MARFYKTAKPNFNQDFIYQPPWQLMQQALAGKQEQYDNTLGAIELFKGQLDIKHRGSEQDTRAAQEIASSYESQADDLAKQLQQDPDNTRNIQSQITKLGRQLQSDRKYGNISQLESTYNNYVGRQQQIKDLLEKGELDATTSNAMLQYYDSEIWKGDTLNNGVWTGEDIIKRPEILNAKNVQELLSKVPELQNAQSIVRDVNGWKYVENSETKFVRDEDLKQMLDAAIFSDPTLMGYVQQQSKLRVPGSNYFDSQGKFTTEGNPIGALYGMISPMSYTKRTTSTDVKVDSYQLEDLKHLHNMQRDSQKYKNEIEKLRALGKITGYEATTDIMLTRNQIPVTLDEYQQGFDDYAKLHRQIIQNPEKELTPQEAEKYANLDLQFGKIASKYDMTAEELSLLAEYQAGGAGWEMETRIGGYSSVSNAPAVTAVKTERRKRAEALQDRWNGFMGEGTKVVEETVKDMNTEVIEYAPSRATQEGNFTYALMDAALSIANYGVYDASSSPFTQEGQLNADRRLQYELDTPFGDGVKDSEAGAQPLTYLAKTLGGNPTDYISKPLVRYEGDYMLITGNITIPPGKEGELDYSDLEEFRKGPVTIVIDRTKNQNYVNTLKNSSFFNSPEGRLWYNKMADPNFATTLNAVKMDLGQMTEIGSQRMYHNTDIKITKVGGEGSMSNTGGLYEVEELPGYQFTQNELTALLYNIPKKYSEERTRILQSRLQRLKR